MGASPPPQAGPPWGRGPSTPRPWRLSPPCGGAPPLPHGGLRPGSRGHNGPHPGRLGAPFVAPRPAIVCAPGPRWGPFCALRVPACAGAPAPARVRSGAARPPPLRGPGPAFAPSLRSPGPPLGPCPPAPPLGVRRGAPSPLPSPLAGPVCPAALPSLRCGLPVRSPLLRLGSRPGAARGPAGSPLGPPASRLRGRLAPAPGALAGRWPAFFAPRPRGLWLRARACAGAQCGCPGALLAVGLSPAPPRPAAPAGGSGVRVACWARGLRAPAVGAAFRSPPRRPPPRG